MGDFHAFMLITRQALYSLPHGKTSSIVSVMRDDLRLESLLTLHEIFRTIIHSKIPPKPTLDVVGEEFLAEESRSRPVVMTHGPQTRRISLLQCSCDYHETSIHFVLEISNVHPHDYPLARATMQHAQQRSIHPIKVRVQTS